MQEANRYLTVTALTKYIKRKFDADPHLQDIFLKGEISNLKQHSSGHMYLTLKDDRSRILAVMFAGNARGMKFVPENGMKVIVRGEISVYEASGQYQIYIKEMKPDGIGELFLAYEQLKKKLEAEGLFRRELKKELPAFPKSIGIITSPTGAAIRDIITTIKRRYPIAKMIVFPALVQGENAGKSVAEAIRKANVAGDIDVLIVGRGGGSIEELWAFNEEQVARAIFESTIPVISAVGHETDFTIADYVADLRAPTPTAAAELAVPHIDELLERVLQRQGRLIRAMKEKFSFQKERLERIQRSYAFRYPRRLYEQKLEQLDRLTESLTKGTSRMVSSKRESHTLADRRLRRNNPLQLLGEAVSEHERRKRELIRAMNQILLAKKAEFGKTVASLEALNPLKIMERGYSLAYTEEQQLIKTTEQVAIGDKVTIRVADGGLLCTIEDKLEE
ncbi:exodeoxyribonuclease VII large subunit [Neobacillus notoginsengisoli]|uniref:Exodeoxyribonuclease 7 large subunit n=1 Tax=Neobacillus notoginsengisoli TaxID=1578198 RepID=A0A417YUZ2_9BACI|nr:exodeoxyribonuclease VII large subunit [Neobacillus notoginsengisoli]RHW41121.1 exodeoxyribonuclease VII large subunit [Neobacillus notoginsengisoli]